MQSVASLMMLGLVLAVMCNGVSVGENEVAFLQEDAEMMTAKPKVPAKAEGPIDIKGKQRRPR